MTYIPRSKRPEWVRVGLIGTVRAALDGSCTTGGYCKAGRDGTATASGSGYRVIKRNSDT